MVITILLRFKISTLATVLLLRALLNWSRIAFPLIVAIMGVFSAMRTTLLIAYGFGSSLFFFVVIAAVVVVAVLVTACA